VAPDPAETPRYRAEHYRQGNAERRESQKLAVDSKRERTVARIGLRAHGNGVKQENDQPESQRSSATEKRDSRPVGSQGNQEEEERYRPLQNHSRLA
jgi:hypothetical protein